MIRNSESESASDYGFVSTRSFFPWWLELDPTVFSRWPILGFGLLSVLRGDVSRNSGRGIRGTSTCLYYVVIYILIDMFVDCYAYCLLYNDCIFDHVILLLLLSIDALS